VRADSGAVVFRQQQPASESAKGKATTSGLVTAIPLKGIAPGRYVLVTEAISTAKNSSAVSRQLPFTIH
jgi:hypothetical protein